MKVATQQFGPFKGLNNISDPMTLGLEWLTEAINVNVTDNERIVTRDGYSKAIPGSFISGLVTKDFQNFFAQDGMQIVRVNADMSTSVLCDLTVDDPVRFLEINREVYFSNGTDSGLIKQDSTVYDWNWIRPDMPYVITNANAGMMDEGPYQVIVTHVMFDGRETGASQSFIDFSEAGDQMVISQLTPPTSSVAQVFVYVKPPKSTVFQLLGEAMSDTMTWSGDPNDLQDEILDEFTNPLPGAFTDFVLWQGQVAWMQYNDTYDTTYIWFSEPLIYHQFRNDNYLAIKGKGALLCSHADALVIGMENEMLSFDGEKIDRLASYGCVPGYGVVADADGTMLIWSKRGWCSVFPFTELMKGQVSPAPGNYVGAAMIEQDGAKRVVAVLQSGGTPFNERN